MDRAISVEVREEKVDAEYKRKNKPRMTPWFFAQANGKMEFSLTELGKENGWSRLGQIIFEMCDG